MRIWLRQSSHDGQGESLDPMLFVPMIINEITPTDLAARLKEADAPLLIDVREQDEREICSIGGTHIPMAQLATRLNEIPRDREVVIYCRSGGRSAAVCRELGKAGFSNLINLRGGILAWIDAVDPSLQRY
jgi:sulfur-carrier protein adenylyltransferase/sulfurtransferase